MHLNSAPRCASSRRSAARLRFDCPYHYGCTDGSALGAPLLLPLQGGLGSEDDCDGESLAAWAEYAVSNVSRNAVLASLTTNRHGARRQLATREPTQRDRLGTSAFAAMQPYMAHRRLSSPVAPRRDRIARSMANRLAGKQPFATDPFWPRLCENPGPRTRLAA
jgi:hypothetical protein